MSREARSFSDFSYHDCHHRFGFEKLGAISANSSEVRYGRAAHRIFKGINDGLLPGGTELDPDAITARIDADTEVNLGRKGDLRDAALWFASEVHGMQTMDSERLTNVTIGDDPWVFRPDAVRIGDDGILNVDEYKTGWIPRRDEAKNSVQLRVYALAANRVFKIEQVRTTLWSIRNRIRVPVDWTPEELDHFEPFLKSGAREIGKAYELLDRQGKGALSRPEFAPVLNIFCRTCEKRFACPEYTAVLLWAQKPQVIRARSSIQVLKYLKTAESLIGAEVERHDEAIRAEVMNAGGEYFDKGWRAWLREETQKVKAKKAGTRKVQKLILESIEGASTTKSVKRSSRPDTGKQSKGRGSSSARSAGRSATGSSNSRAGGKSKRRGSR